MLKSRIEKRKKTNVKVECDRIANFARRIPNLDCEVNSERFNPEFYYLLAIIHIWL